jgi:hypothetical protein
MVACFDFDFSIYFFFACFNRMLSIRFKFKAKKKKDSKNQTEGKERTEMNIVQPLFVQLAKLNFLFFDSIKKSFNLLSH